MCFFFPGYTYLRQSYIITWNLKFPFPLSYSLVFSLAHPFFCQLLSLLDAKGQAFSCGAIHCFNTIQHSCRGLAYRHCFSWRQVLTILMKLSRIIFPPTHFKITVVCTSICKGITVLSSLNASIQNLGISAAETVKPSSPSNETNAWRDKQLAR